MNTVNNTGINMSGGSIQASKVVGIETHNNNTENGNTATNIGGNQIINNHNQDLIEAASEIQKLLEQLEKSNPTATEDEQITYVNIENPNLKQRWKAALKDATEKAIDEFLLENKFLKVTKAFLTGWLQPT
jgi:hypothetical protein